MTASLSTVALATPGTLYVPGDTVFLAGGTGTTLAEIKVSDTQVVAATVVAAGTGGTTGTQIISGTTGSGSYFSAKVTVAGGAISGQPTILTAGDYTSNPTTLAAEPVSGGGLVGATLALTMGALAAGVAVAGVYSVPPLTAMAQSGSTGAGTGATWVPTWAGLTANIFRANFTSFSDASLYPDTAIAFWQSLATAILPLDRLGSMYDYATQLFMAHNLSVERINQVAAANGAAPGMSRGAITSEAGPAVSVAFDTSSGMPANAGHWALTVYGTRFLDLVRRRGAGVMQVGIGVAPPFTGGAWAGPSVWVPSWFTG